MERDDTRRLQILAAQGDGTALSTLVRRSVRRGELRSLHAAGLEPRSLQAMCIAPRRRRLSSRCLTGVLVRSLDALLTWHDDDQGHGGVDVEHLHLVVVGRTLRAVVVERPATLPPTRSPLADLRDLARALVQAHLAISTTELSDAVLHAVIGELWSRPMPGMGQPEVTVVPGAVPRAPDALEQLLRGTHLELRSGLRPSGELLRDARHARSAIFGITQN